jgi:hypothetical protein
MVMGAHHSKIKAPTLNLIFLLLYYKRRLNMKSNFKFSLKDVNIMDQSKIGSVEIETGFDATAEEYLATMKSVMDFVKEFKAIIESANSKTEVVIKSENLKAEREE